MPQNPFVFQVSVSQEVPSEGNQGIPVLDGFRRGEFTESDVLGSLEALSLSAS